jgi:hypothetical protein
VTCLAFTFLNPHVYLDTVLLVGGLSGRYEGEARLAFAIGAMSASFLWFFGLGYGARVLEPLFAKPSAWRVLDGLIALVMAALSAVAGLPVFDWLSSAITDLDRTGAIRDKDGMKTASRRTRHLHLRHHYSLALRWLGRFRLHYKQDKRPGPGAGIGELT